MKNQAVDIFQKNKAAISETWSKFFLAEDGLQQDLMSNKELSDQSNDLLDAFVKSLSDHNIDNPASSDFEPVIDVLDAISIARARQGYSPRDTGAFVFSLKDALMDILQKEISAPQERYDQTLKVSKLIDSFSINTFETFILGRQELITRQMGELSEISTPVIEVWDGILALPIIGTLDSARTQVAMENLLQRIVDKGGQVAILDISGVPAVDSLVAQHLLKTVSATRLMGAECIISGIRPEIAQTVVHLGIDLSGIITKATLASALKTAFAMIEVRVLKEKAN